MVSVLSTPIDVSKIIAGIITPQSGGTDLFIGTVRNHSRGRRVRQLEYSAYMPMAEKIMAEIELEIRHQWVVHEVALVHRVGMLAIGDVAVVTAISAAHRDQAFQANRYAIHRVKTVVPIWKQEHYEEGLAWVVGQHDLEMGGK